MIVALAAVEESWNSVTPAPLPVKKELMLMILELAADELLKNLVVPPKSLIKRVKFPAVAPLVNTMDPEESPTWLRKSCVSPEVFMMPTPLMVNVKLVPTLIVNTLAFPSTGG